MAKANPRQPKGKVVGKPEVLARFTPEQLADLEERASRISERDLAELDKLADAAARRVETTEQVLRALRAARVRKGLTQGQIDKLSGIGRANISRLENLHLDNPTLETVLRYADAVGLRVRLQPADETA